MELTREKLLKIIESLGINFNEGIQSDDNSMCPRILFWDYAWEPVAASGSIYNTIVTYQISYMSYCPPRESDKLLSLMKSLETYNKNIIVNHEYVEKDRIWHSFFSLDILENL